MSFTTVIERSTIDTNILIYSIDRRDIHKHDVAIRVVNACSAAASPLVLQTLSEFFRAVTRKGLLSSKDAVDVVHSQRAAMPVVAANEEDMVQATELCQAHQIQFFDALLVATALRAGCTTLFSEDFSTNAASRVSQSSTLFDSPQRNWIACSEPARHL